jgi:hypothetical protein
MPLALSGAVRVCVSERTPPMNFPVGYMECWARTKHEAKIFSLAFACVDVARVLTSAQPQAATLLAWALPHLLRRKNDGLFF